MRRAALLVFGMLLACSREGDSGASKPQGGGGGSVSGGSGGAGGSTADLRAVAAVLDGFVMTQPCLESSGPRACRTHPAGLCPKNSDPARTGALPTDAMLSFGGRPGTLYDVSLRVQGIVEPRVYRGGADSSELATNGFLVGGAIDNSKDQHSAYALSTQTSSYFFNSLGRENLRHSVFAVDYEAAVTIEGGASLALVVSDPNCEALKNCGDPDVPTECVPLDLPNLEPKIREKLGTDPASYDGQFLGFVVKAVAERK